MIKQIRESKWKKVIACYLALMIFLEMVQPLQMYALTGGPSQPEFNSFTPIGTSDMVDLASGDMNYNIPLMDVGGYPLNLAYNSNVSMDQEASWVGLGWDLNVGQINRQVRGLPDDFKSDKMIYENNMKPNVTIGGNFNGFISPFGLKEQGKASVGLGVKYNNYDGFGFSVNGGLSYQIAENVSVGMNLESSSTDGVSASPSVSMHRKKSDADLTDTNLTGTLGVSMNSRKGVETVTLSASRSKQANEMVNGEKKKGDVTDKAAIGGSVSLIDASFTPTKRVGMSSSNIMFSVNLELPVMGFDPGGKFSGYRTTQGIKDSEKYKTEKAFGYENTGDATTSDILDFNREKDRTVTTNTVSLPLTNYTYDLYSAQGQGVSGMFRPYRSQVGYVYDNYIQDDGTGGSLGGEYGTLTGTHWGFDATVTDTESSSSLWTDGNAALSRVREKKTGNRPNYEKVFFKNVGGLQVDKDFNLFETNLGGYNPVSFKINGGKFSRGTEIHYYDKLLTTKVPVVTGTSFLARNQYRLSRNQSIQKLTRKEASRYGFKTKFSPYSKKGIHDHHTSEIRILKEGGEHYIYGRAAYNGVKKEVTFDVGTLPTPDCRTGLVAYGDGDNSVNNKKGNQYFNRVTTPAYAHTFLLTSVLSSDYQDISNNGPTDDDLGSYTKFNYTSKNTKTPYKWRIPYKENFANYDEGLRSLNQDNKGNYQYGEKELLYINKIETKTHIAIFTLSARKDGYGVKGENGGANTEEPSKMWKLEKISLYSKPEYLANPEEAIPIKTANFVYDYSLCKGVHNNMGETPTGVAELANQKGKLTLKKVFFTYRNSNMGRYAPYVFNYDETTNFDYDQKSYDIWGNYKPTGAGVGCLTYDTPSNAEAPYVGQKSKADADKYAAAWLLKSIELPSGGMMEMAYESDDYKYVQNRETMQMFDVVGAGSSLNPSTFQATDNIYAKDYLYIRLDDSYVGSTAFNELDFFDKYLKKLIDKPVFFRFMLNMTNPNNSHADKFDYVTGYVQISPNKADHKILPTIIDGNRYAAIKINMVDATPLSAGINPISNAGFHFGRQYLNNVIYSFTGNEDVNNIEGVVKSIINLIPDISNIFKNPDAQLREKSIASQFIAGKSWIRLMNPAPAKFGGGSRVKEIKIHDQWDVMTEHPGQEAYKQHYGQQYNYSKEDGTSSGVATYEPLGSKENPFVEPFYNHKKVGVLLGPEGSSNYTEMPFGESFYPSPKITYSKVTVRNLPRAHTDGEDIITLKKHATGSVVSEFFTSYDYPTISDFTKIDAQYDTSPLGSILNIYARTHLSMSQGFSIHTNDMDGKMKSQWVYAEGQTAPISGMEYRYDKDFDKNLNLTPEGNANPVENANAGMLNNKVITVNSAGEIKEQLVGVDYDVINDFRQNKSTTETAGIHFNTEGLPLVLVYVIVVAPIPSYSYHENMLRTAATTKVIHSTGILRGTIAHDVGSTVYTKNLAWDADTGEVLVTETNNEYNDIYYNFNFPAYWANKTMGQAATNLGLEWKITGVPGQTLKFKFNDTYSASDYLANGDVLWITSPINKKGFKAWVVDIDGNSFRLIDANGVRIPTGSISGAADIKIVRSAFANMQSASMASVTSMKNPLFEYSSTGVITNQLKDYIENRPFLSDSWDDYRIVNASAIEYNEEWPSQCECGLPKMTYDGTPGMEGRLSFEFNNTNNTEDPDIIALKSYNPYLYNILGNWKAVRSYAYLTGRNSTADPTPRKTGFFNKFGAFYKRENSKWIIDNANKNEWTFASEISKYNPYGQEVENMDALFRYSSAYYGYNNRFPVAVASNTKYRELAFDGFEDYDLTNCLSNSHFNFVETLSPNKITITDQESHTGRRSIRLEPGNSEKALIRKKVVKCDESNEPEDKSAPVETTAKPSVKTTNTQVKKLQALPKTTLQPARQTVKKPSGIQAKKTK